MPLNHPLDGVIPPLAWHALRRNELERMAGGAVVESRLPSFSGWERFDVLDLRFEGGALRPGAVRPDQQDGDESRGQHAS